MKLHTKITAGAVCLLAGALAVPGQDVLLLTGADLTAVFAARNAQLAAWALAAAAALALGWALAARFGRSVTEPLAKLEHASRAIAAGAYGSRTGLRTDDEIGALSAHFDAMAAPDAGRLRRPVRRNAVQRRRPAVRARQLRAGLHLPPGQHDPRRAASLHRRPHRLSAPPISTQTPPACTGRGRVLADPLIRTGGTARPGWRRGRRRRPFWRRRQRCSRRCRRRSRPSRRGPCRGWSRPGCRRARRW